MSDKTRVLRVFLFSFEGDISPAGVQCSPCASKAKSRQPAASKAATTLGQTPFFAQRLKRVYVVYHFPNSDGRSLQGDPVRTIQKTASKKARLSLPEQPGSPDFPGKTASTAFHRSSFRYWSVTTASSINFRPFSRILNCILSGLAKHCLVD